MIDQVLPEKARKLGLLGSLSKTGIERLNENFDRLESFKDYLSSVNVFDWEKYKELRRHNHIDMNAFDEFLDKYIHSRGQIKESEEQFSEILLEFEKKVFAETVGANAMQLKPI
jgi:hypothetical protein